MTAEQLLEDFRAFERTLALRTAIELDLFTRIGAGAGTVAALARALRSSECGLRILCDYLTVWGYLTKRGTRYSLPLHARLYLCSSSPIYIGAAVKFIASDANVAAFCRLPATVKKGRAVQKGPADDNIDWVEFARSMACVARPVAEFAAAALVTGEHPLHVLDLAAGHGLYGLAIAERNPGAHVFALDSADVLREAAGNARRAGLAKRWHAVPGDAFHTAFGGPYDLIVAGNFAHHLDEAENVRLFRKSLAALKPGGRLALIDVVPHADRVSPAFDAAFALHVLATTAHGGIYTFAVYKRMLRAAGFAKVLHLEAGEFPRWIITARKPALGR